MLDYKYGQLTLHCNGDCDNEGPGDFGRFDIAQAWMKSHGWIAKKVDGEWEHYCPECRKKEESEDKANGIKKLHDGCTRSKDCQRDTYNPSRTRR